MGKSKTKINIFWHRRDIRLQDNHGLFEALAGDFPVLPLFIFDRDILDKLEDENDRRVTFIHEALKELKGELKERDADIEVRYGFPEAIWKELLEEFDVQAVFTNEDYEPYAVKRDSEVEGILKQKGIPFHRFKDSVLMSGEEVLKDDGKPYTVYTPYSKKWKKFANQHTYAKYPSEDQDNFLKNCDCNLPSLHSMGFEKADVDFPSRTVRDDLLANYHKTRDLPAMRGTSRLGVHLRFGTISVRALARRAKELNVTFLGELIWRDFYQMILHHFPYVAEAAFREKYERIEWLNDEDQFDRWKEGKTGYPLVDAGMRELLKTGYMHNRVRMVVASFLTKHLLIDWRWGEAWFARLLLDFDLASNNGGWQWAAGCGTDAAPYFRVFNPASQAKKFDPNSEYIKKWVPEFGYDDYPEPIIDHKFARERALSTYKAALK